MPLTMKIQPIDSYAPEEGARIESVKPVVKSRLKRLFERQFLRSSSAAEKVGVVDEPHSNGELEPNSLCLANMVQSFIEDNNEKQHSVKCGRNCFNGNCDDSSEDEFEYFGTGDFGDSNRASSGEACEVLKSLVPCSSVSERNLLADTAKIVDQNKMSKRNDQFCRKTVTDGLIGLGYDSSLCKSRWDKSSSHPAGEYEYIDVIMSGGERLVVDIDFRSEFEIARSTKAYKLVLQALPHIFVGNVDRLQKIITVVSEAAKQSMKKKGMHIPPWRKVEYVKAKWLSPCTRMAQPPVAHACDSEHQKNQVVVQDGSCKLEVSCEQRILEAAEPPKSLLDSSSEEDSHVVEEKAIAVVVTKWKPPEAQPKSFPMRSKVVTGLASVIGD